MVAACVPASSDTCALCGVGKHDMASLLRFNLCSWHGGCGVVVCLCVACSILTVVVRRGVAR